MSNWGTAGRDDSRPSTPVWTGNESATLGWLTGNDDDPPPPKQEPARATPPPKEKSPPKPSPAPAAAPMPVTHKSISFGSIHAEGAKLFAKNWLFGTLWMCLAGLLVPLSFGGLLIPMVGGFYNMLLHTSNTGTEKGSLRHAMAFFLRTDSNVRLDELVLYSFIITLFMIVTNSCGLTIVALVFALMYVYAVPFVLFCDVNWKVAARMSLDTVQIYFRDHAVIFLILAAIHVLGFIFVPVIAFLLFGIVIPVVFHVIFAILCCLLFIPVVGCFLCLVYTVIFIVLNIVAFLVWLFWPWINVIAILAIYFLCCLVYSFFSSIYFAAYIQTRKAFGYEDVAVLVGEVPHNNDGTQL